MDERFECCRYEPSLEDLLADEVMTACAAQRRSRAAGASRDDGGNCAPDRGSRAAERDKGYELAAEAHVPAVRELEPDPQPGTVVRRASTEPSCRRATARTRLRPRPLPGVLRLGSRRTKRSNTVSRSASGMPGR